MFEYAEGARRSELDNLYLLKKLKIERTIVDKAYNSLATNKDNKHLQKWAVATTKVEEWALQR